MATRSGIVEAPPHPTFTWNNGGYEVVGDFLPFPPNNVTIWKEPNISPVFMKSAQRILQSAIAKARSLKGQRVFFGVIGLNENNGYDLEWDGHYIKNSYGGLMDLPDVYLKIIQTLTEKAKELTPLAVIYARQNRKKRIRKGIMAGDEGYYPLNKFWDYNPNDPNEGAFLSEFQREMFKQDEILKGNLDII